MHKDELSSSQLEEQLIDLQTQISFQEDTIGALNDVVTLQQQDILQLKQQLQQFLEEVRGVANGSASSENAGSVFDDRPPHY